MAVYKLILGVKDVGSDEYAAAINTTYYNKVKRDEAIGDNGTLYMYIYSDAGRTNLLDTLSVALTSKVDFRYFYVAQNTDTGGADECYGWLENLDLQEASTGFAHSVGLIMG